MVKWRSCFIGLSAQFTCVTSDISLRRIEDILTVSTLYSPKALTWERALLSPCYLL